MSWQLILIDAWRNLIANQWRALLAALGIIISAATVVILLSIGEMAEQQTLNQFKQLGTDLMAIDLSIKPRFYQLLQPSFLTPLQWIQLSQIPGVIRLSPYSLLSVDVAFHGQSLAAVTLVTMPSLLTLLHTTIRAGRLLSDWDRSDTHCMIGASMPQQLKLTAQQSLGKYIQIQHVFFTIIGVLKPWQGNAFFNANLDDSVIITYPSALTLATDVSLTSALLQLKSRADMTQIQAALLQQLFRLNPTLTARIHSAKVLQQTLLQQKHTLNLLLDLLATIALLAGGINIMNVMLVAVSERKQEIGLRLAIGASQQQIRYLFLTEAAILGLIGGVIGTLLGELSTVFIAIFSGWPFYFYGMPVLLALTLALFSSVCFGFYPAHQAARLNPIRVLNT